MIFGRPAAEASGWAIGKKKRDDQHMKNVTLRHVSGLTVAAVNAWLVCVTVCAVAAQIENPPTKSAATLVGGQIRGANYEIDDTVRSDGFLYIFSLNTTYGRYQVEGLDLLKIRLHELGAVAALEKMNKSQAYVDAASKAAMKPVNLAAGLVTNPVGTVEQSMSGVGALFSRIGSSAANIGHDRDDIADSTLGVSSARRKIANKLGVDPYTDFKPLADALEDMARVTALGDLTVSAAFMAIPGGAGMAVSYSKTSQEVEQMVLEKTPSELRDVNKAKLSAMGVPGPTISAFLDNTFYTPTDQTIIVASLAKMGGVANRGLFVKRASQASNRNLAVFIRHRAQLLAAHHSRVEPFADFFEVRGLPLNRTRSGKVVIVVPFDELAWTKQASDLVAVIDQEVKQRKVGNSVEVRTTGTATPLARDGLSEQGWKVFDNISP
jgi:hypothetical protein